MKNKNAKLNSVLPNKPSAEFELLDQGVSTFSNSPVSAQLWDELETLGWHSIDFKARSLVELAVKARLYMLIAAGEPEELSEQLALSICRNLVQLAEGEGRALL